MTRAGENDEGQGDDEGPDSHTGGNWGLSSVYYPALPGFIACLRGAAQFLFHGFDRFFNQLLTLGVLLI